MKEEEKKRENLWSPRMLSTKEKRKKMKTNSMVGKNE